MKVGPVGVDFPYLAEGGDKIEERNGGLRSAHRGQIVRLVGASDNNHLGT